MRLCGGRWTVDTVIYGEQYGMFFVANAAQTQHKTYVESFPSRHAGEPIPHVQPTSSVYDQYTTKLGADSTSATNPWAPFTSQLDWEIARWAKLRGPGSNAFSELISIPGVSHMPL